MLISFAELFLASNRFIHVAETSVRLAGIPESDEAVVLPPFTAIGNNFCFMISSASNDAVLRCFEIPASERKVAIVDEFLVSC